MTKFTCATPDCPENGVEIDFGQIEVTTVTCGGCSVTVEE